MLKRQRESEEEGEGEGERESGRGRGSEGEVLSIMLNVPFEDTSLYGFTLFQCKMPNHCCSILFGSVSLLSSPALMQIPGLVGLCSICSCPGPLGCECFKECFPLTRPLGGSALICCALKMQQISYSYER